MWALVLNDRVAQVEAASFEVAEPLRWIEAGDDVRAGWFVWPDGTARADDPAAPPPDMAHLRAEALKAAMAYGNAITGGEIAQWAGIEPLSWAQQREEALIVRAGGALPETAVLPGLAEDKGVTLASYADDVWANAERYQDILRAAVHLRRRATAVLSDAALDTPAKLGAAVAALRVEADALAAGLIGA